MMVGETVFLEHRRAEDPSSFAPSYTTSEEMIGDVLVIPGALGDLSSMSRIDGSDVRYTLHFPKTFDGDLEGSRVKVRGRWCLVIGRPDRFTPENTPGRWNLPVQVIGQQARDVVIIIQRIDPDSEAWSDLWRLNAAVRENDSGKDYTARSERTARSAVFTFDYDPVLYAIKYDLQSFRIIFEGHGYSLVSYEDTENRHQEIKLGGEFYG